MRILIAYDGSEPSRQALNQGVNIAKLTDSHVTILTVAPRIMIPLFSSEVSSISTAQEMGNYYQDMKDYYSKSLKKGVKEIERNYPELQIETMLKEGRPSSTIVETAEEGKYDLIVIGSRGLGGISGWLLGSTSKKVVESCKVPILVVK